MLEHQINRLKKVKADRIVLATTTNSADDCLVDLAKRLDIGCFRGSEEDVLGRVVGAAKEYKADTIIQTTADCPVIDPNIVEQVYRLYNCNSCIYASNTAFRSYPDGMDTQVFGMGLLKQSVEKATSPKHREHVGLWMRERINGLTLIAPPELYYPELRLTLDYEEDYIRLKDIIEHFDGENFNCLDIINYLKGKENENILQ